MANSNKQVYNLSIDSADMTAWAKSPPETTFQEFYVEVQLDQKVVYATKAVERSETLSWNEEFQLIGNTSSTISMSIVQQTSKLISQIWYISCVNVELGTLLAKCAHEFIALEITSIAIEANQPKSGIIRVKLIEGGNPNNMATEMVNIAESQLSRFECLGNLTDLDNAISSMAEAVALTDEGDPSRPSHLADLGCNQHTRFLYLGELADLDNAVLNMEAAVVLTDDGHPDLPRHLSNLGNIQQARFDRLGNLSDLANAISNEEKAVELTDHEHPNRSAYLIVLGITLMVRFQRLGSSSDLDDAISNMEMAVELTDDGHPRKPIHLSSLGSGQQARFEHLGNLSDLENAISNTAKAVELTDDGHPDRPMYLSNLGGVRQTCFERFGNLSDLENAISDIAKAVDLTGDGHPDQAKYLSNLGYSQQIRFEHLGNLSDLENAISNNTKAVELTDDGHPAKPMNLCTLGHSQHIRFERFSNVSDLENAISCGTKAVELTDDRHPAKPIYLNSLGHSQRIRFERFGNSDDLENAIWNVEKAAELTNDRHPTKPIYLSSLGINQQTRFEHLGKLSDLENAISNIGKAVELVDDGHPSKAAYLSNLGMSQQTRFAHLANLSDLENAISNTEMAVKLTDDGHLNRPTYLLNLGICQMSRFKHLSILSDLENAISNMEIAVEFTDDRHAAKPKLLSNLGNSQQTRFEHFGNLFDLENAISNMEMAVELSDEGHSDWPLYLSNLGNSQQTRFVRLGNLSDLDNAISNAERAVKLTHDRHSNSMYLLNLGNSQRIRFGRLGNLTDLENAISNIGEAVKRADDGQLDYPIYLSNLGVSQMTRFKHLGSLDDLENAISNMEMSVELTDDGHPDMPMYLSNLGGSQQTRFEHLGNLSDLEDAISNTTKAVALTSDGRPDPVYFSNLGNILKIRFDHLGNLSDLNNAISNMKMAIELTDDSDPYKARRLFHLGFAQQDLHVQSSRRDDIVASVSSFKASAQLKTAYPYDALSAARKWAEISHLCFGDLPSALTAYRTALELLPKVAWLGLDTPSRQDWLFQEESEDLGCLAATCAIQLRHFEEAIELLDLGKSVFWQQAASLRGDLQFLREEEPGLAAELEGIGRRLDAGNFSDSLFNIGKHNVSREHPSAEDIGNERRHLVGLWERLVERVRMLPRFKYFLKPVPFDHLRQVSVGGNVIIINSSIYGVDALIFGAAQAIIHVPLPNVDHEELAEFSGNILLQQPAVATDETQRKRISRHLRPALRAVWNNILVPIFTKLGVSVEHSAAAPQHRIWWYPTGPLTFIPIHAASSGCKGATDVSRLVISSYITSLSSLLQVQERNRQSTMHGLKLLAVSQPNTAGLRPLPQSTVEVEKLVDAAYLAIEGCSKEDILHLSGSDATVNRVSAALESSSWVHFACHGFQDTSLGMKSAFALHDGNLELGEIARKRLPNAQFAFLSACHAASGLNKQPGEAMHLAAGFLFAGFSSVVATTWGIRDEDAPKVAVNTYQYLFRNGMQQLDPSEAATALNRAILLLREDPNVSVDRWAPFIHFGI